MSPPQAAARFAREKKTLMKKHCMTVARQNTSRNTKITDGSLYLRTFPYYGYRDRYRNVCRLHRGVRKARFEASASPKASSIRIIHAPELMKVCAC